MENCLDTMIAVGPGGDYLQHPSTFQNCRSLYMPEISDWNSFEDWKKAGERDVLRIAHEKCSRILEENPGPQTLAALVARIGEAS